MNKLFKKVMVGVSSMALLVGNFGFYISNTNAAAIEVDSISYDDTADTITVTDSDKDYSSDNISALSVTDSSGTGIGVDASAISSNADGEFVITDSTNLDGLADDVYTVAFTTVAGDYTAATFVVGAVNEVTVSAEVLPILSMNVTPGTTEFGTLDPASDTTIDIADIEVGTNAQGGLTVTSSSANSGLLSSSASHTITDGLNGGEVYQISSTANAADPVQYENGESRTDLTQTASINNTIYSNTAPEQNDLTDQDVTVSLRAGILELTPSASDYTDTITFNVTGSF